MLEAIDGADAVSILKILAERHLGLAAEIDAVAAELLEAVDVEDYAAGVQLALEGLAVEDVWDQSGQTRTGYVDPGEAAWTVFQEALEPFREDVAKYRKLSLLEEANRCYQGMLKGIYDFSQDETPTEFKEWAEDVPEEAFGEILREWKAMGRGRSRLPEMRAFVTESCPRFSEWATRDLHGRGK